MLKSIAKLILFGIAGLGWPLMPAPAAELKALPKGYQLVALDDCGIKGRQSNLVAGTAAAIPETNRAALNLKDARLFTSARGRTVALRYAGVFPGARYAARVFYCNPDAAEVIQTPMAGGRDLAPAVRLPPGLPVTQILEIPPETYRRGAVLDLAFRAEAGGQATVSAVELWSDRAELMPGDVGPCIRFQADSLPAGGKPLTISDERGAFAPVTIAKTGLTPWFKLKAGGVMLLRTPPAGGATLFGYLAAADDSVYLRRILWDEPGGSEIIMDPLVSNLRTLRDMERANYRLTLDQTGERLRPLTRPPLLLGNSWGKMTGPPAEYMVKTLRLLGMNCVETISDQAKYAGLYGWTTWGGTYRVTAPLPFDLAKTRAWQDAAYSNRGAFAASGPLVSVFQLSDEPDEFGVKAGDPEAEAGFRRWLAGEGVAPGVFGQKSMESVGLLLAAPKGEQDTQENRRRYYWSRRYKAWLTPKAFALAGAAVKRYAPNPAIEPFVALSGHSMYLRGKGRMPMDMFSLASYPEMMPGISDWMSPNVVFTGEEWRFLTHETIAYSAAIFNSGARRSGADFGRPPVSRSMMHCVYPSLFRAYAMLAHQVKYITYYNYGPQYDDRGNRRAAAWAGLPGPHFAVQQVNNQAALADDILGPGVLRPSRVALLYARSTEYYGWPEFDFTDRRALFFALSHEYYRPELVTEEQIAAGVLEHYDALYAADQWVAAPAQEKIAAWVRAGGLLWSGGPALRFNEFREPHDLLAREFGLRRSWDAPDTNAPVAPVKGEADFAPHNVSRKWTCGGATWPDARVRARYADGTPAWLEKQVDRGRVVFLLHRPGSDYLRHRWPQGDLVLWVGPAAQAVRDVIAAPLREARVERELTVSVPALLATPISAEAGTAIVFYNQNRATNENAVLTLKAPAPPHGVQVIRGGASAPEDLPHTYTEGAVRIVLPQLPATNDGLIITVRPKPAPPDPRPDEMRKNTEACLAASEDWQALAAGAWFAGFFQEWNLAAKLPPLLKHENWSVRRSAAEALGRLKFAAAGDELRAAFDRERDPHVLADLLVALDRLQHRDVPALAGKLVEHDNPLVNNEAAAILARLAERGGKND